MKQRILGSIGVIAGITVLALVSPAGQGSGTTTDSGPPPKTSWGEPDLQGIWASEEQVPLQRPARFAGKEFFTEAEIAELDKQRAAILRRELRQARGSEEDVNGAYNGVFQSVRHTGRRTSLIVDPADGRIPPFAPEAQKRSAAMREYRLALLQATDACKNKTRACAGGKYGPPSPRREEPPPFYNSERGLNRAHGPEDLSLPERCMGAVLPDFSSGQTWGSRRILQSPGSVAIFYDVGQGQGFHRTVPVTTAAHLPQSIRQYWGDSRGRWDGNTLVVDVTNFSPKTEYQGSRENLHLIERWTRTGPDTLEYLVTLDDPTTWTRPWTAKQQMTRQSDEANRIYYEPRCHEGNYGLVGVIAGARAAERAFAEGKGPNPATRGGGGSGLGGEENQDPLD